MRLTIKIDTVGGIDRGVFLAKFESQFCDGSTKQGTRKNVSTTAFKTFVEISASRSQGKSEMK